MDLDGGDDAWSQDDDDDLTYPRTTERKSNCSKVHGGERPTYVCKITVIGFGFASS